MAACEVFSDIAYSSCYSPHLAFIQCRKCVLQKYNTCIFFFHRANWKVVNVVKTWVSRQRFVPFPNACFCLVFLWIKNPQQGPLPIMHTTMLNTSSFLVTMFIICHPRMSFKIVIQDCTWVYKTISNDCGNPRCYNTSYVWFGCPLPTLCMLSVMHS